MLAYTVRRILIMVPTLLAISVVVFTIIELPPGSYFDTIKAEAERTGDYGMLQKIAFWEKEYCLDCPLWQHYGWWIWDLVRGDMGFSFEHELPVREVVGDRLALSFLVSFVTLLFIYAVSFPIGIYSAIRQYSLGDYAFSLIGFLGLATPNFLLALVLLYFANVFFGTSIGGLMDPQYINQPWSWAKFLSILEHIWVPVIVIGTSGTAAMIRRLRANLLDELQKQYVVTGRAKGLSPARLLLKYPLRMALNPFIADIGSLLPQLISSAAIVSIVMNLPTTGPMLIEALQNQDRYLAGSFLMFLALLTVIGMFLSDLALAALDPRIRLEGGATR